jgi:hypothetical protein
MSRMTYSVQVYLRFRDSGRELLGFSVSAGPGYSKRKRFYLL